MTTVDVLVIGAGQAGLAAAYWLKRLGTSCLIVDAGENIGDRWRRRYRSLTLFTPREFSGLPGLALTGDPAGYASGAEFGDYLGRYAAKFGLAVEHGARVVGLAAEDGLFLAQLGTGQRIASRAVIVATGGFQTPVVPTLAAGLSSTVHQLTAETYSQPADIPPGSVLVVGDGASGRDIAADLAASHKVALATGRPRRLLPERILGVSTWKWLKALGLLSVDANSPVGRYMRTADPFPNRQRKLRDLRNLGVEARPRVISAGETTVGFEGGGSMQVETVIWALGYRDDSAWVNIPGVAGDDGRFLHTRGKSPIEGLFFVGRPWQRNRASALIMGAGPDAEIVCRQVAESLGHDAGPRTVNAPKLA